LVLVAIIIGASVFFVVFQKKKKKHLTVFAILFMALIVACLVVGFFAMGANKTVNQGKHAMTQNEHISFMKNVLLIDVSKYAIELKNNSTLDLYPGIYGVRSDLRYELTSKDSDIDVMFTFENYTLSSATISERRGQVFTTRQYTNQADAVEDFLKRYQTYTNIDSNTPIAMLNSVDTTKDTILITKDVRLVITHSTFGGVDSSQFMWTYTNNDIDSSIIGLIVDKMGNINTIGDSRAK
jgi:hypothetical protein